MNIKKISMLFIVLLLQINQMNLFASEEKESDRRASKVRTYADTIVTQTSFFDELYPELAYAFSLIGVDFNEFMRTRLAGHYTYEIITNEDGQSSTLMHNAISEAEHFISTTINDLLQRSFDNAIETGRDLTPDEINLWQYADDMKDVFKLKMLPKCFNGEFLTESLFLAVGKGNIDIARRLLERGADINYVKSIGSLLHVTAHSNDVEMVKFLIESGINVNLKDSYGWTAVFWPCTENFQHHDEKSRIEIVELMIHNGMNVNKKVNKMGQTLLSWAIKNKHPNIISMLIDKGVDVNFQNLQGNAALPGLLIMAARSNNMQIVNLLLLAEVNINARDVDGCTALLSAVRSGHTEIVDRLIAAGANVNIQNNDGKTPLMIAGQLGYASIVDRLIIAGANVNIKGSKGDTALMYAAAFSYTDIIQQLIAGGADINNQDRGGRTALMIAAKRGHAVVIEILIAAGANVNSQMHNGTTALMCAVLGNNADVIQTLIAAGANVNLVNRSDQSAIDMASEDMRQILQQLIAEQRVAELDS